MVVPKSFMHSGFQRAMEGCLVPVVVRPSGGRAVMHGPDIANITLYRLSGAGEPIDIGSQFAQLGEILFHAIRKLGAEACSEKLMAPIVPANMT